MHEMTEKRLDGSNWLVLWPEAAILHGEAEAQYYTQYFHQAEPIAQFMVTELDIGSLAWGWMSPNVWEFTKQIKAPNATQTALPPNAAE